MADSARSYYWCCIAYPETMPEDWERRLELLHIGAVVSPLHSPDPDPDTQYERKPHYHVMFMYDSMKSLRQARTNMDSVFENGYTKSYIIPPDTKVGMLKYFCHLKSPKKEKLRVEDVKTFGGIEYLEEIAEDKSTFYTLLEITEWIHRNHCCSFIQFMLWAQYNNQEWARIASTKSTMYVNSVISSERNWYKDMAQKNEDDAATTTSRAINNQ